MEAIRIATYFIVWLLWAVIGFICWVPLLVRATASVAAAILYCTITESDPTPLKKSFENAISFYARGFEMIDRVLLPNSKDTPVKATLNVEEKWWRVALEMLWTVAFWGGIALSIYSLFYDPASARYREAQGFFKQADYENAIKSYCEAIDSGFKDPQVFFDRGRAYVRTNKNDLAAQDYERYIRLAPNDPYGYYNLGISYGNLGKKDSAIPNYRKVIELNTSPDLSKKAEQQLQSLGVNQ